MTHQLPAGQRLTGGPRSSTQASGSWSALFWALPTATAFKSRCIPLIYSGKTSHRQPGLALEARSVSFLEHRILLGSALAGGWQLWSLCVPGKIPLAIVKKGSPRWDQPFHPFFSEA